MPLRFKETNPPNSKTISSKDEHYKPKIQVVPYTEKSFVVIGDTYFIKDLLKASGGKWNPNLKQKEDISKGWIFPIIKINVIKDLIATTQA